MKKVKNILLIILFGLILFTLSGCGKDENTVDTSAGENSSVQEENDISENEEESFDDTKTKKIFEEIFLSKIKPIYIKYRLEFNEGSTENEAMVTYAINGDTTYTDTLTSANRATTLQKGDIVYAIMHDTKTYIEFSKEEIMLIDNIIDEKIIKDPIVKKGKETIKGTEYEYEQLHSDGEYNRFYYMKGTDILKYWKLSDGQLLQIEEYGNDPDNSWFEIPSDYVQEYMNGQDLENELTQMQDTTNTINTSNTSNNLNEVN